MEALIYYFIEQISFKSVFTYSKLYKIQYSNNHVNHHISDNFT